MVATIVVNFFANYTPFFNYSGGFLFLSPSHTMFFCICSYACAVSSPPGQTREEVRNAHNTFGLYVLLSQSLELPNWYFSQLEKMKLSACLPFCHMIGPHRPHKPIAVLYTTAHALTAETDFGTATISTQVFCLPVAGTPKSLHKQLILSCLQYTCLLPFSPIVNTLDPNSDLLVENN